MGEDGGRSVTMVSMGEGDADGSNRRVDFDASDAIVDAIAINGREIKAKRGRRLRRQAGLWHERLESRASRSRDDAVGWGRKRTGSTLSSMRGKSSKKNTLKRAVFEIEGVQGQHGAMHELTLQGRESRGLQHEGGEYLALLFALQ